ncbi:MAG: hypothetical protein ABIU54_06920 [Candidatus Eisenbacteria bacterium]
MQAFDLSQLSASRRESGRKYLEFLRHDSLSAGLYELSAGADDA